jgi:hypothetical protein
MTVTRHASWFIPMVPQAAPRQTDCGRRSNGSLRTVTWRWMRWRKWRRSVAGSRRLNLAGNGSRARAVDRSPGNGVRKDLRPRGSETTWRDSAMGSEPVRPANPAD